MRQFILCWVFCILMQLIAAQSPRQYQFCASVDCPIPECEAGAIPVELPKHRFECCTRFECMPCSSSTCGYQCMGHCPDCPFGQYCNLQSCQCVCTDGNVPAECSSSRCNSAATPRCMNYPEAICSSDGCNDCATVFLDESENILDCGETSPENPYFRQRFMPYGRRGGGGRGRSRRPYYPPPPPRPRYYEDEYNYDNDYEDYNEYGGGGGGGGGGGDGDGDGDGGNYEEQTPYVEETPSNEETTSNEALPAEPKREKKGNENGERGQ